MTSGLDITRHYGWAEIRIDRETKRNAMDRATRQAMLAAFEELRPSAKAIVITGTGMAFCAGMDLKEREQDRLAGIDGAGDEWVSVNIAIRKHPAIFIAAVNGVALGGGATLINVCDLAVASTQASIGCPEMGFATYPAMAGPAIQEEQDAGVGRRLHQPGLIGRQQVRQREPPHPGPQQAPFQAAPPIQLPQYFGGYRVHLTPSSSTCRPSPQPAIV